MPVILNGRYVLQAPRHYRHFFRHDSNRLYRAAWAKYRRLLRDAIDYPTSDSDVCGWLESIMAESVNNPRSTFYIYG